MRRQENGACNACPPVPVIARPASQPGEAHKIRRACVACPLHEMMVCADIGAERQATLQRATEPLTMRRGEVLFQAHMPAARVYFIRSGFIKLVKYSSNGGQRIVRIIEAGGVAGMETLFSSSFENAAIAMSEVVACSIPAAGFRRMIDDHPALQRQLLGHAHLALRQAETWLSELAGGNASIRERTARLLLCLRDGDDRIPRLSLEDIGAILGVCVETVCRVLTQFKREGLLTKDSAGLAGSATMPLYYADIGRLEAVATGVAAPPGQRKAAVA